MLKLKNVTDLYDMRVFTDLGDYFGDVEEGIISSKGFWMESKGNQEFFLKQGFRRCQGGHSATSHGKSNRRCYNNKQGCNT